MVRGLWFQDFYPFAFGLFLSCGFLLFLVLKQDVQKNIYDGAKLNIKSDNSIIYRQLLCIFVGIVVLMATI